MRTILKIWLVLLISVGCNNSKQDDLTSGSKQDDTTSKSKPSNDSNTLTRSDTVILNNEESPSFQTDTLSKLKKTADKKQIKNRETYDRYIEFPGDANFNGKPMTQQEEIPKEILEKHPDTLSKLAIARYKTYDNFFPKSIADNFEEMKSTEHIYYPKVLIFRFELFENCNAFKPYLIKEVIVRRNTNGEVYTEN
jgi:uncharacterized lipoprotein NlpE involved in copper resistance